MNAPNISLKTFYTNYNRLNCPWHGKYFFIKEQRRCGYDANAQIWYIEHCVRYAPSKKFRQIESNFLKKP